MIRKRLLWVYTLSMFILLTDIPLVRSTTDRPQPINPDVTLSTKGVFWSTDHETGDLSDWVDGGEAVYPRGGIFNTPSDNPDEAEAVVSSDYAHSGSYSARASIYNATHSKRAVRLMRWGNIAWDQGDSLALPEEAYYSAWYYFPQAYNPSVWWNVFQFKSNDAEGDSQPIWALNIANTDGEMGFYLYSKYNPPHSYDRPLVANQFIPVGEWVHVEAFYRQSSDDEGHITIWQDGVMIYDIDGVQTTLTDHLVWGVGNYTDDITPSDVTIYIDDATISKQRIGG